MNNNNFKHNQNVSLESTNTRLTGNIKLVLDTEENLFLESINSNSKLSSVMFKGFHYNILAKYGENVKNFIDSNFVSADDLYAVKSDKSDLIDTNFNNQLSSIYKYGCYSEASQLINENLRFFAPIYLNNLANTPDLFVIVKQDANTILSSEYFASKNVDDLISSGSIVHIFDLTILKNIFKQLEESKLYVNFDNDKNEDSVVISGLNYQTGFSGSKSYTGFADILDNETTMSEFNNSITNMFKNVDLLFSNILNLEFAFTDSETNGFANYTGVYLTKNELNSLEELKNHQLSTKFIEDSGIRKLTTETTLSTYKKLLGTSTSISSGLQEYQKAIIKFSLNPEPQTKLELFVNNVLDYSLTINRQMIGETIKDTLYNICNEINTNFTGEQSTIEASYTNANELVLVSKHLSDDVLFIDIDSSSIDDQTDIVSNVSVNDTYIRFKGSSSKTFVSKFLYESTKQIKYKNTFYNILAIYEFEGSYYYESETVIETSANFGSKIEHYDIILEKPVIGEYLPHCKLDTSIEDEENYDVLDFDSSAYQIFLLNRINSNDFVGSVEDYVGHANPTTQEIEEYKLLLTTKVNQYFNSFVYSKNYLIKNLNLSDKSISNDELLNPFERLSENKLVELRQTNRLHQFIQKWQLKNSVDSYFNPYLLNISLALRSDNFCSSPLNELRDLTEHTLHWFIIGSGKPPYFVDEKNSIQDELGYTKTIVTKDAIESTSIDYYANELTYNKNGHFASSWGELKYDSNQETCFVFFKGVKYKIDDKSLNDYKFAVIVKTDEIRETSNGFDIEYIKNDTFKTFTILLYFYIPEPILTSIEGDIDYFVDRSLFYFSNEIYASKQSKIDFGEATISLDLYNTLSIKKYNLNYETTNFLVYNAEINKIMMFVGRGNLGRFQTSFKEILELGGSLTCFFTGSEDETSPYYGMKMIFSDIVEIHDDGFWCTEVTLHTVQTEDIDGIRDKDISDDIVTNTIIIDVMSSLSYDSSLVDEVNIYYYSKYIARELFMYNKIVSSSANNLRYKSMTLANFATLLDLQLVDNPYNMSVVRSDSFYAPISLESIDYDNYSELKKLANPYLYPMHRYEGNYVPLLKTIYEFNDSDITNKSETVDYKKFVTVLNDSYVKNKLVQKYEKPIISTIFDTFNYLVSSTNNVESYLTLPWSMFNYELRNLSSVCFNSDEEIVEYVSSTEIALEDICNFKQSTWLNLQNLDLQTIRKFYKHSIGAELSDDEILRKIKLEFIKSTFLKIYMIYSITDVSGKQTYEFSINDTQININDIQSTNEYLIKYKR